MSASFKTKLTLLVACFAFATPFPARALFDFGGRVLNTPGTIDSILFAASSPVFPPEGVDAFWDTLEGTCLNGVEEVDQLQALGVPQPPVLLQFIGQYTFAMGPATHPGQLILGKYGPPMVCTMNYVFWVYCGTALCPVVIPLPFFFAPLIIFNGSSI